MNLYYGDILLGTVETNSSMTVEQALYILNIDMDVYEQEQGWDDWQPGELRLSAE